MTLFMMGLWILVCFFQKPVWLFQFLLNPTSCSLAVKGAGCTQCNTRLLYLWQSQRLQKLSDFFCFPLSDRGKTSPKLTESVPHHPGSLAIQQFKYYKYILGLGGGGCFILFYYICRDSNISLIRSAGIIYNSCCLK